MQEDGSRKKSGNVYLARFYIHPVMKTKSFYAKLKTGCNMPISLLLIRMH